MCQVAVLVMSSKARDRSLQETIGLEGSKAATRMCVVTLKTSVLDSCNCSAAVLPNTGVV